MEALPKLLPAEEPEQHDGCPKRIRSEPAAAAVAAKAAADEAEASRDVLISNNNLPAAETAHLIAETQSQAITAAKASQYTDSVRSDSMQTIKVALAGTTDQPSTPAPCRQAGGDAPRLRRRSSSGNSSAKARGRQLNYQ